MAAAVIARPLALPLNRLLISPDFRRQKFKGLRPIRYRTRTSVRMRG